MTSLHARMLRDPRSFLDTPYDAGFDFDTEQLSEIHLTAIARAFERLRPRIGALTKLAQVRGIDGIRGFNEAVSVFFPHTVYKSYALSLLDRGRYQQLTHWLGGVTALDLGHISCDGVSSLDEWIDRIEETTAIVLVHTFGTTGKLSFIPRTRREWRDGATLVLHCIRDWNGRGPDLIKEALPIVQPTYRGGAAAAMRGNRTLVSIFSETGPCEVEYLYPDGRFSADVASLAGRLRAAEAQGDLGELEIPAALRARQEEFERLERQKPERLRQFFERVRTQLAGRNIYLCAVWPVLFDWAQEGLRQGLTNVFGAGSVLNTGGGTKGRALPEGWREDVLRFLGVSSCHEFYAMSELIPGCPRCAVGNYHVPPVLAPFALDLATGELLPREKPARGRFACFDLLATDCWGGFITGDEVTLGGWDTPCGCGRRGPFIEPSIARISPQAAGDDKINCGGAPRAHEEALQYMLTRAEQ